MYSSGGGSYGHLYCYIKPADDYNQRIIPLIQTIFTYLAIIGLIITLGILGYKVAQTEKDLKNKNILSARRAITTPNFNTPHTHNI
jgi:hypothetical protein